MTSEKIIFLDDLYKMFGDDEKFVKDMLALFCNTSKETLDKTVFSWKSIITPTTKLIITLVILI